MKHNTPYVQKENSCTLCTVFRLFSYFFFYYYCELGDLNYVRQNRNLHIPVKMKAQPTSHDKPLGKHKC